MKRDSSKFNSRRINRAGSGVVSSPTRSHSPRSMKASIASLVISMADSRNRSADPGEKRLRVTSRNSWVSGGSDSIGRIGNGSSLAGTPTEGKELNRASSRAASKTDA
ncbi:Uncharacterised protein [Mycobacterium tuberculosis]|nr:Uncharacterised protein [Mycobacterium tuberculosis]